MIRIIAFSAAALSLGALLAILSINTSLSTGWIGALALISWSLMARRRWAALARKTDKEPGAPERALWIQCAGYALLLGHLTTALLHTEIDLHVGRGNTLAIDSWLMILAALSTVFIFRHDRKIRDERDLSIAARGVKASYFALVAFLISLLLFLGYAPPNFQGSLTDFAIANILVTLILASYLVQLLVKLYAYARDTSGPYLEGPDE